MLTWKSTLRRNAFWCAVLLLIGFVVWFAMWHSKSDSNQLQAVVSVNDSTVHIDRVSCLSIDPHKVVFDRKDYWDAKLAESVADVLSIKMVLLNVDYATCPWGLSITVVPGTVFAVRYEGRFAKDLVSIGICERTVKGSLNPDKCLSKNVYVFASSDNPHVLFLAGLVGLAKPQVGEWDAFQTRKTD
jgi:hypothetical protein